MNKLPKFFYKIRLTFYIPQNMPESLADTVGGKIFTFGSYRLGALIRCIIQSLEINISTMFTIFMTLRVFEWLHL